jgi:hypothetical protein
MWFNSGSWQAQLGLFLAHIALSTASGQSIRGAVLNNRVTAGKKPMHAIYGNNVFKMANEHIRRDSRQSFAPNVET